jgi:hypothetical protein
VAYISTYKCDSCGIVKKDVNNWFTIEQYVKTQNDRTFYITRPFNEPFAFKCRTSPTVKHACGLECAAKIEMRLKAEMHSAPVKATEPQQDCSGENWYMKNEDILDTLI